MLAKVHKRTVACESQQPSPARAYALRNALQKSPYDAPNLLLRLLLRTLRPFLPSLLLQVPRLPEVLLQRLGRWKRGLT